MHSVYFDLNPDVKQIAFNTANEHEKLNKKKFLQTLYQKIAEKYTVIADDISEICRQNNEKYPKQKKTKA